LGTPEGKRLLGRPRCRLLDNIKMDLGERGLVEMEWTDLDWGRDQRRVFVNMVKNLWSPITFLGHSKVAAQVAVSRKGLSSIQLVTYLNRSHFQLTVDKNMRFFTPSNSLPFNFASQYTSR
jgi:hypothetical protein